MGTTLYILALMTSINCGVDVICLRAVEAELVVNTRRRTLLRKPALLRASASGVSTTTRIT